MKCRRQLANMLLCCLAIAGLTVHSALGLQPNAQALPAASSLRLTPLTATADWSEHLTPYTDEALADQVPLILIHGIGGTRKDEDAYEWEDFIRYSEKNPEFHKRFKIYLFHYNSYQGVPQLSETLRTTLRAFIAEHPKKSIRVLAHSEGGILFRNAIHDPVIAQHTEKAITLGTPFHGSPLANAEWVKQQVEADSPFAPLRLGYKLSYWIARKQHPSFEKDFAWDNFDQSHKRLEAMPETAENFLLLANSPIAEGMQVATVSEAQELPKPHAKIITYGSYFGTDAQANQDIIQALDLTKDASPTAKRRLFFWLSKHGMFDIVRNCMAKMPIAFRDASGNASHMMAYNDGISPISSTLWLGRFIPKKELLTQPASAAWHALKGLKGLGVARLLPAVDHKDWLEGKTRNGREAVPDLLNPQDQPKMVFDWLMDDLMS